MGRGWGWGEGVVNCQLASRRLFAKREGESQSCKGKREREREHSLVSIVFLYFV